MVADMVVDMIAGEDVREAVRGWKSQHLVGQNGCNSED